MGSRWDACQVREKRLKPLATVPAESLLLHEVYASIQGESSYAGRPCTFVRTTACNLRCCYCDTPHAFGQGHIWQVPQVLEEVQRLGLPLVEVTGGEPLLQASVLPLMTQLCDGGWTVLLETSGSLDIRGVDPRVVKIMDLKTPFSGEEDANLYSNIEALALHDEVKFVIGDRNDYLWACQKIAQYGLTSRCTVLLGCVFGALEPRELGGWIVQDKLGDVRMQIQMHKYIWDPKTRGV